MRLTSACGFNSYSVAYPSTECYQVIGGSEQRLGHTPKLLMVMFLLFIFVPLFGTIATASASPNVGLLRVSDFLCPGEVVPGARFPVSLDVEYAIQSLPNEATIRGAVYGSSDNLSNALWQSTPTSVSNGGDQVWNFTLTAPVTEGFLNLTAYAYFLDNGTWTYFNNPVNGPGVSERTVKIGKSANLDVNIGATNIAVTVDGTTKQTSTSGDASFPVAVNSSPSVTVPSMIELPNSTRIIFTGWNDGISTPERQVQIDGDVNLTAQYRMQYLLTLTNGSTVEVWFDKGANSTLTAPTSVLAPWPLSVFGVTETFRGWSGDIQSSSPHIIVTMNSPKTITADMATDYRPLVIPTIFAVGVVVAIASFGLARLRLRDAEENATELSIEEAVPDSDSTCPKCGQVTEPEWAHCIKCGTTLKAANSPSQVDS